ncbi:MAG: TnpV protein [Clostridia bacterium]|nr:TnpV protein [Clostridia bacterium]
MELLLILFIDENLKDTDPLKWVGLMNNYKNSAKEIIYSELIAIYFCTVISS